MDTSDTNGFVLKTQHNTDKLDIQKKIDEIDCNVKYKTPHLIINTRHKDKEKEVG